MSPPWRTILLCSCDDTMSPDAERVARVCRGAKIDTAHQLCRAELERFRAAAAQDAPLTVGCTQEAPLFAETAPDADIIFANIRETAGWSTDAAAAGSKIAALIAAAAEPMPPTPIVSLESDGVILIYGRDEKALEAAALLKDRLDATVLLTKPGEIAPPRVTDVPIVAGTIAAAKGHLGAFELTIDDYAAALPSSRAHLAFGAPRDGATARCDILLDLSGGAPLFPAADLREGYLRADPRDESAVLRAVMKAGDLVGTFDKPRYINFTEDLCAHSLANRRLPTLPRFVPNGGDRARQRLCRDRRAGVRRLRQLCGRLPDRRRLLRAAARGRADAQAAHLARRLPRGRRGAADFAAARRESR